MILDRIKPGNRVLIYRRPTREELKNHPHQLTDPGEYNWDQLVGNIFNVISGGPKWYKLNTQLPKHKYLPANVLKDVSSISPQIESIMDI